MPKSSINRKKIFRPAGSQSLSASTQLKEIDDVIIQITQAFCPNGHNLVTSDSPLFEGAPGIDLWVDDGKDADKVTLSPYHGDHSRMGRIDYPAGTKINLACPICKTQFLKLTSCSCEHKGELYMIYLTPSLSDSHIVGICNVWGCYRSKVFDQAQLMASYLQD